MFKGQITRFLKTKHLTKDSKKYVEDESDLDSEHGQENEFDGLDEEEKDEIDAEEFAQNNLEALSDFVPSDKEDNDHEL